MSKRSISLIVFLSLSLLTLSASNYYASPNGNGNGQSASSPCSFADGVNKLSHAGDTLFLLAGQYNFSAPFNINNKNNVVITAAHGLTREQVILDFRTEAYGQRGIQVKNTCTYLTIKTLTIRYSGKNAMYNEGSYCTFENLDIYGNGDTGCQMKNGGHNNIINCDSHDNFDYGNTSGADLTFTNVDYGGNADGFADKQYTGGANTYIGCRAWNNSDDGWDFFQHVSASTPTIIHNCICFKNGPAEYDMRNHGRYETDRAFLSQFVNNKTVTDRAGGTQTFNLQHFKNYGNGNGFKLGGEATNHKVKLDHCLSVYNTVKGFDQNNNNGVMELYNCSAYQNGIDYGFGSSKATSSTLIIKNSLSYRSQGGNGFNCTTTTNDHNTWNLSVTVNAADFMSLDTSLICATRATNGDLPIVAFMRLKESSDLIDKGVDVGYPFAGNAPDLGCYEFGEVNDTVIVTPPPTPPVEIDSTRLNVAYLTIPNDNRDARILAGLQADTAFATHILSANNADNDYSHYDLVVVSPVPNSTAPTFEELKGIDKPLLVLKPFLFKNTVWNWGTPQNTQDLSLSITAPNHKIFNGLGNIGSIGDLSVLSNLTLFELCTTNAITGIASWTNCTGIEVLATTENGNLDVIIEAAAGANLNGTTLTQNMLMVGVSEYSTADLTNDGVQLIVNACRYLLGVEENTDPTPDALVDNAIGMQIQQTAERIMVIGNLGDLGNLTNLKLYNIAGQLVRQTLGNTILVNDLPHGIYVLSIGTEHVKVRI